MPLQKMIDVETTIKALTLSEKVALLSGEGACRTIPIERLGIPSLQVCYPLPLQAAARDSQP